MTKKFMATLLAASIAFTTVTAAPVQARNNDAVKAIAGIALLAIIGKAISDSNHHSAPTPVPHTPRYRLPNRCLRDYETQSGWTQAYGSRCLANNLPRVSLPHQCKRTLWTAQGRRNVYLPGCMSTHGFRIARR